MNNKTFDTAAAMSEMSDAMVSEAARAGKNNRRAAWIAAAAAALVLAVGAAVVLPKLLKHDNGEVSAAAPTETAPAEATQEPGVINAPEATGASGEPAYSAPTDEPEFVEPTGEPAPHTVAVSGFDSVGALNMAVRSGLGGEINGALEGLSCIFMPAKVPYGAELADITVEPERVVLTYNISEEWISDESDPNRFVLVWFRNWQEGSAESFARSLNVEIMGDDYLHLADGAWILRPASRLEMLAVWEHEGSGFEIIVPGNYSGDGDVLAFTGVERVELGGVDVYAPSQGFTIDGYMWLSDDGMGFAPLTATAGNNEFLDLITEDMRSCEGMSKTFPTVGMTFEPVLLEDTDIVRIDVYNMMTLEPIAMDISLDELYDIAMLNVDGGMSSLITGSSRGCVLVDMVISHGAGGEARTYHCGFLIECGA